jgi:16S rRNA (guanine527-N7)-methyltransferase
VTHAELTALGITLTPRSYERLAHFVVLLLDENTRLNLTAVRTPAEVWRVHILDSLAALPRVARLAPRRLLDIGSGGGVPGVPLACACETLDVTLLDATRKKVAAMERIIAKLELANARSIWDRAEALANAPAHSQSYDAVTARAVAKLPVLVSHAGALLRSGGEAWFYKSAAALADERRAAEPAARAAGLRFECAHAYHLPGEPEPRQLLVYRRQ